MDHCTISAQAFHNLAERYRQKFMDLTLYNDSYKEFCSLLRPGYARVLDAACGPGNVSRFLLAQRPDLHLLGIDLAPRMIELAREAVPSGKFAVFDCRRLPDLQQHFDGIICAFGLPYLSKDEATAFIRAAHQTLETGGVLYISAMLGKAEDSGFVRQDTGDQVFVNYHDEEHLTRCLEETGFSLQKKQRMASPSVASKATTDIIMIVEK